MSRLCTWCGSPYESRSSGGSVQRFCSKDCRQDFNTACRIWATQDLQQIWASAGTRRAPGTYEPEYEAERCSFSNQPFEVGHYNFPHRWGRFGLFARLAPVLNTLRRPVEVVNVKALLELGRKPRLVPVRVPL